MLSTNLLFTFTGIKLDWIKNKERKVAKRRSRSSFEIITVNGKTYADDFTTNVTANS